MYLIYSNMIWSVCLPHHRLLYFIGGCWFLEKGYLKSVSCSIQHLKPEDFTQIRISAWNWFHGLLPTGDLGGWKYSQNHPLTCTPLKMCCWTALFSVVAKITLEALSTFMEACLQWLWWVELQEVKLFFPWNDWGFTCSGYDYLKEPHYVYRPKPKKKKAW